MNSQFIFFTFTFHNRIRHSPFPVLILALVFFLRCVGIFHRLGFSQRRVLLFVAEFASDAPAASAAHLVPGVAVRELETKPIDIDADQNHEDEHDEPAFDEGERQVDLLQGLVRLWVAAFHSDHSLQILKWFGIRANNIDAVLEFNQKDQL